MPVISRFYGIAILMFLQDHHPPHFHAKYEGQIAVYSIKGCRLCGETAAARDTISQGMGKDT